MKNRRWLWAIAPALGLACLFALGSSAMQAQVGSEPRATPKARPVERATPATEDRAVPADAPKNAAVRRTTDENVRKPAAREDDGHQHQGGGWLGVYVADSDEKSPAGAQISQIFPASPAARAGFRAGDVITQVNDHKVTDPQSFVTAIEAMPPGTKAAFAVQRNDQPVKLTATLGQNYWTAHQQDQDFDRNSNGMRGRGYNEEEYPIYAMELEHNRRVAEQHERMEQMLLELKEEVHQLREELKGKK